MGTLVVPPFERRPWPTLGRHVCEWLEAYLVHGPGDLLGDPYRLDDEKRALVYRMYEVFPKGHPQAGRRRFKRVAISLRKGSAKTEFAAAIVAAELHPDAPVRCDGFDRHGEPIGRPVRDPYIPMVSYSEEMSEELAYGALLAMLERGPLADDFDLGLERIMRKRGDGKAVALASSPNSRDGARTTFQHFDETHRFILPRLRQAHRTMLANIPKRKLADAWSLETTTAPAPGEGSVAEHTMDYGRAVARGEVKEPQLFFYHREAGPEHDLATTKSILAAVLDASGPIAEWSDIGAIVAQFEEPGADRNYLERVWLNRSVQRADRAFDALRWRELARPDVVIPPKEHITLGFDGSRYRDATGLIATHVASGYQWVLGIWQRKLSDGDEWEVPVEEVEQTLDAAFKRWKVWRLYADPPYWETHVHQWAGTYGKERVVEWWTNRHKQMAFALRGYAGAIVAGDLTHDGNPLFAEHIANTVRRELQLRDDDGKPLWIVSKERPDSPNKIDAGMAGCLSWEARMDALKSGVAKMGKSPYKRRGALIL